MASYSIRFDNSQMAVFNNNASMLDGFSNELRSIDTWASNTVSAIAARLRNQASVLRFSMETYSAAERGIALDSVAQPKLFTATLPHNSAVGSSNPMRLPFEPHSTGKGVQLDSTSNSNSSAWFYGPGYRIDDRAVSAWLGWTGARVDGEHAYAGAQVYFGKAEAGWDAGFSLMGTQTIRRYVPGKGWEEKEVFSLINAGLGAYASVALVTGNAEAGVGCDLAGISVGVCGAIGKAVAEGDIRFGIGEDGVNAYASGNLMVAAVQGRVRGTINILGLQINAHIGGYAGAVGVHGEIGIRDNQFVMRAGLAAVLGVSAGVTIGFNDTGVQNIVNAGKAVADFFMNDPVGTTVGAIQNAGRAVADFAVNAVNTVADVGATVVNAVTSGVTTAVNTVSNSVTTAVNAVSNVATTAVNAVANAATSAWNRFTGLFRR